MPYCEKGCTVWGCEDERHVKSVGRTVYALLVGF